MAGRAKRAATLAEHIEGPWALPSNWHWRRLGDTVEILDSLRRPLNRSERASRTKGQTNSELIPYYGATGRAGWIDDYLLDGDYVLLGEDGAPFLDLYASKAYSISGKAWVNNHAHILRETDDISGRFLLHALNNTDYSQWVNGTTRLKLTQAAMREIPLPCPPIDVQTRIASRIDELFLEIEDGEQALADARAGLDTFRRSLLRAAFAGELTEDWRKANPCSRNGADYLRQILEDRRRAWFADVTKSRRRYVEPVSAETESLPELPEGWTWASLQQVAFISGGITVDQKRKPDNPVEVPYLRVANVQRGYIDLQKVKMIFVAQSELESLSLKPGDVLLNEGGDRNKVGRGWIWEGQLPVCVHQNHVFKARPATSSICPPLVSLYLNEMGRQFFLDEGKQTTNLASISLSKVARAPVPIPPPNEANAIMLAISDVSNSEAQQAKMLQSSFSASVMLRRSILSAAFRGELG